jgi:hypothetical protein
LSRHLWSRRPWRPTRLLVTAAAVAAVLAGAGQHGAASGAAKRFPGITFEDRIRGRLVITAPGYQLTLAKRNGRIIDLIDRTGGARVVLGSTGCLWRTSQKEPSLVGGCAFTPRGARRFSYRWDRTSATLRLGYRASRIGSGVVTLRARAQFFDLRLRIENHGGVVSKISFPDDLLADVRTVGAGYAPNVLPGVLLRPGFFARTGNNLEIYPSRWAFADYLGLDVGGGHLSLYSVESGPIHPLLLGFLRQEPPGRCSGV